MATMTETQTLPPKTLTTKDVPVLPATASCAEVVDALKVAGGVIIRNAMSLEDVAQIEKDVRPYLEKDGGWDGNFFPKETRRCMGLLDKSPTAARALIMNPLYQEVCTAMLSSKNWFWEGMNKVWATSRHQINNSIVFSIRPGAMDQPLHRDNSIHHIIPTHLDVYPEGMNRDTAIGYFVAGKKTTKMNGATRFIPGSHLWAHEREPDESLCQYAELEPGDAFMMLASCLHGGSANKTVDEERLVYSCFMTKSYLRQEENQYLAVDMEKIKKLPIETQKIAGYSISEPFLGWIDLADPRMILDPTLKSGNADIWSTE